MVDCFVLGGWVLEKDGENVEERVRGRNNNHSVFLSVKVFGFVLVKAYRSPLPITISGRFWKIPASVFVFFRKNLKKI